LRSSWVRLCSDPTQVCLTTSLRKITTFPRFCSLWNVKFCYSFFLKRCLKRWRKEGLFKLCLTSTSNRYGIYWMYQNKLKVHFLKLYQTYQLKSIISKFVDFWVYCSTHCWLSIEVYSHTRDIYVSTWGKHIDQK